MTHLRNGNQADMDERKALADKLRSQAALTREDRERLAGLLERRGYSTPRHHYIDGDTD